MTISITSNIADVVAAWKRKPEDLSRALNKGLKNGLEQFMKQRLMREQLRGRKSANYGLNVGTGNALRSLNVRMYREGPESIGVISTASSAWYLKLHQHYNFDGYARVKNGTTFCVPVHPLARGKWPRMVPDLVLIKRPGKNPLLVRVVDKGSRTSRARFDIMYVLTKRIFIPKRLHFYEEFEVQGRQLIRVNILESLKEVARAA